VALFFDENWLICGQSLLFWRGFAFAVSLEGIGRRAGVFITAPHGRVRQIVGMMKTHAAVHKVAGYRFDNQPLKKKTTGRTL
jgi:hypothetical protein